MVRTASDLIFDIEHDLDEVVKGRAWDEDWRIELGINDARRELEELSKAITEATGRMKSKKSLLEHYATGDVHKFTQIDGWPLGVPNSNTGDLMQTDKDGDCLIAGKTEELRHSPPSLAVRIFIHEGTEHRDATRLIRKMLNWLERSPGLLGEDWPFEGEAEEAEGL